TTNNGPRYQPVCIHLIGHLHYPIDHHPVSSNCFIVMNLMEKSGTTAAIPSSGCFSLDYEKVVLGGRGAFLLCQPSPAALLCSHINGGRRKRVFFSQPCPHLRFSSQTLTLFATSSPLILSPILESRGVVVQGQVDGNVFLSYDCGGAKIQSTSPLGEESGPLTLQGRMMCLYKEDGHISGSWQFGFNGQIMDTGQRFILGGEMKEKWENDTDVTNFLKRVSMGDCRDWLQDFMVPWEKTLKTSDAHSLCLDLTVKSQSRPGQPWCQIQGAVDTKPFLQYDSDSNKVRPLGFLGEEVNNTKAWTELSQTVGEAGRELRMVLPVIKLDKKEMRGIDPRATGIEEEWENNQELAEYFRKISTGDYSYWLREFLKHWENMLLPEPTEPLTMAPNNHQPASIPLNKCILPLIFIFIIFICLIVIIVKKCMKKSGTTESENQAGLWFLGRFVLNLLLNVTNPPSGNLSTPLLLSAPEDSILMLPSLCHSRTDWLCWKPRSPISCQNP
ncbi:hypothetical protein Celaphus_00019085, partial [Cervus elaphus hippelaphus]